MLSLAHEFAAHTPHLASAQRLPGWIPAAPASTPMTRRPSLGTGESPRPRARWHAPPSGCVLPRPLDLAGHSLAGVPHSHLLQSLLRCPRWEVLSDPTPHPPPPLLSWESKRRAFRPTSDLRPASSPGVGPAQEDAGFPRAGALPPLLSVPRAAPGPVQESGRRAFGGGMNG